MPTEVQFGVEEHGLLSHARFGPHSWNGVGTQVPKVENLVKYHGRPTATVSHFLGATVYNDHGES